MPWMGFPGWVYHVHLNSGKSPNNYPAIQHFLAPEICDNGIDDDLDGFVDQFDTDCPCSLTAYQAYCAIDCEYLPDSFPDIQLSLKWRSEIIVNEDHVYPNIVVGDMNHDGIIDVVTKKYITAGGGNNFTNGIAVFNGSDGNKLKDFNTIPRNIDGEARFISIADVNSDGVGEYFFSRLDTLICMSYDGATLWKSDRLNTDNGYAINLADFNGDGIPEVYRGNNIVNAQTGKLLVRGNGGSGCNFYQDFNGCDFNHTIAADVLPAPGLELAAGNTVYEVNIVNTNGATGNSLTAITANNPVKDGVTSVGDIDGDGQLDVIVVRNRDYSNGGGVWVWNPRTRQVIASGTAGASGGVAFIGNVAGDCKPEIGVNFENQLKMFSYNGTTTLQVLYNLNTTDGSGYTGVTMFDFNQDGLNELVYRDEDFLRIMEGSTGANITTYPIQNGTGMEYPVVADVDNDGEAEILVSGYTTTWSQQRLFCFESGGTPWAPARSVWNQPGYHVTNVNDDLTIPRYQQNQATPLIGYETCLLPTCPAPYNAFMAQATFRTQQGCVQFPAADLSLDIVATVCVGPYFMLCLSVENSGDKPIPNEPVSVSFWSANPLLSPSTLLDTKQLLLPTAINTKDTICIYLETSILPSTLYVSINDPGNVLTPFTFPLTDLVECNFTNNIDSITSLFQAFIFEIDTTFCEGETLQFLDSTIVSSGDYTFQRGVCDSTIILHVIVSGGDTIIENASICDGDSILFNGSWLKSTGTFTHLSVNRFGCDSLNVLQLIVEDHISKQQEIFLCTGDSIWIVDRWIYAAGYYRDTIPGIMCDTIAGTTVTSAPTYFEETEMELCPGDSVWLDNHWITDSETVMVSLYSIHGCDSTTIIHVNVPAKPAAPELMVDCAEGFVIASSDADPIWTYRWNNGSSTSSTTYNVAGPAYLLLSIPPVCEIRYDFDVPDIPKPFALATLHDTVLLEDHPLQITLGLDPDEWTVAWSPSSIISCPGCLTTRISPTSNTSIHAQLMHSSGCIYETDFNITLESVVSLYIPNVFSPNGDQVNDEWHIINPGDKIEILKATIFDRWGNQLKEWKDTSDISWDGFFRGKPMNPGVFTYAIEYIDQEMKKKIETGNITLLR